MAVPSAGAGRQCHGGSAATPASSDISDAMAKMQERLNRLNGEVQVQSIGSGRPGLPPRHGRRAGAAVAVGAVEVRDAREAEVEARADVEACTAARSQLQQENTMREEEAARLPDL